MAPGLPPGRTRQAAAGRIREDPQAAGKVLPRPDERGHRHPAGRAERHVHLRLPSPAPWFPAALDCTLGGVSWQIRCPALVTGTEAGRAFKGQARSLYDAHLP